MTSSAGAWTASHTHLAAIDTTAPLGGRRDSTTQKLLWAHYCHDIRTAGRTEHLSSELQGANIGKRHLPRAVLLAISVVMYSPSLRTLTDDA